MTSTKTLSWGTVYLVCSDCRKRKNAPKDARPKTLAKALGKLGKGATPRARAVMTGCLGLCPKGATAVARVGGTTAASIVAVATDEALSSAYEALRPASGG